MYATEVLVRTLKEKWNIEYYPRIEDKTRQGNAQVLLRLHKYVLETFSHQHTIF
jgi:hypothetical protein